MGRKKRILQNTTRFAKKFGTKFSDFLREKRPKPSAAKEPATEEIKVEEVVETVEPEVKPKTTTKTKTTTTTKKATTKRKPRARKAKTDS